MRLRFLGLVIPETLPGLESPVSGTTARSPKPKTLTVRAVASPAKRAPQRGSAEAPRAVKRQVDEWWW